MKVQVARVHPYRLGLRSPIATAHGMLTERRGFLVELTGESGQVGWGDACPIDGFGMEGLAECQEALKAGCAALLTGTASVASAGIKVRRPAAKGALEVALIDLSAREQGQGFAQGWALSTPSPRVDRLSVSGLVVGSDAEEIKDCARTLIDRGHQSLKLKVANRAWSEDRTRIQALADSLSPGVQIRLDANGGWTEEQARHCLLYTSDAADE